MAAIDDQIQQLANSLQITGNAFNDLLAGLVQVNNANQAAANSTLKNVNARTIENELLQKREEREQAVIKAMTTFGSSLGRSISGLGSFSSALYSATTVFDTARITLDTFNDIFKAVTKIVADSMGIFRFFSGAGDVLKNIADSGVELAINALKNRIEQARIITDTFQSLSKSGATFGGSIAQLTDAAKGAGINLQEFGRFITANVQNLVGYGASISQSAKIVGQLTRTVGELDPALLAMKGSLGVLAESTTEYLALQRMIGRNELNDSRSTSEAVRQYIRMQNELTEITGRNAGEQRLAEQRRREVAAYQMAMDKLEKEDRIRASGVFEIFDQFGADFSAAMQEYFANNGQMINAQNITFATMNRELFDMGVAMLGTIRQPTEQFKTSIGKIAQDFSPALRAQQSMLDQQGMNMLAASKVGGPVVEMQGRVAAAFNKFIVNFENLDKILDRVRQEAEGAGRPGQTERTIADSIKIQNELKAKLDDLAVKNIQTLPTIIQAVDKISTKLVEFESGIADVANAIIRGDGVIPALKEFKNKLKDTIEILFSGSGGQRPPAALPPTPRGVVAGMSEEQLTARLAELQEKITTLREVRTQETDPAQEAEFGRQLIQLRTEIATINRQRQANNPPGQQEGGIATEPTIVGENNQPEAVIPLARGSIPLNINFDPMLRILEQQREYLEEILSATEDNSDYLERIYHATA